MSSSFVDRDCSRPNNASFSRSNAAAGHATGSRSLPRRRSVNSVNPKASFQSSYSIQSPQFARKAAQVMLERRRTSAVSLNPESSDQIPDTVSISETAESHLRPSELTHTQISCASNCSDDRTDIHSTAAHQVSNNYPAPLGENGQLSRDSRIQQKSKPAVINVTVDEGGIHFLDGKSKVVSRNNSRSKIGRASSRTRQDFRQRQHHPWSDDKENGGAAHNDLEANFSVRRQSIRDWKHADDGNIGSAVPTNGMSPTFGRLGEWDGSMPRRHSSRSFIHRKPDVSKQDEHEETFAAKQVIRDENAVASATEKLATCKLTENCSNDENCTNAISESAVVDACLNSTCAKPPSEKSSDTKMPERGRWCDNCAGVGLIVAALLADREKRDAGNTENSSDDGSPKKGGWRSVVLGDSGRSKLEKENARLTKENKALFDVIHQLQRRLNELRTD